MKLYIVGPVASGKSTLARQLSRETGIPCFHLDQVARRQDPGAKVGNRKRTDEEREAIFQAILAREDQGSTAIEAGIAVPHAKSECVLKPSLAACILKEGVDYGAMDGMPSDLFFMIAAPMDGNLHLEILSHLMVLLMDPEFVAQLRQAKDADAFMAVIDKFETAKYGDQEKAEEKPQETSAPVQAGPRILAITACPTGIAHTYIR